MNIICIAYKLIDISISSVTGQLVHILETCHNKFSSHYIYALETEQA